MSEGINSVELDVEDDKFTSNNEEIQVEVLDARGRRVAKASGSVGSIEITDAIFWWPYSMNGTHHGYLYTLKVGNIIIHLSNLA